MHQGRAAGTTWDPAKYGTFADHRLRPGLELLDRIPLADPKLIYDLGCGPGDLTRIVADRWPGATVIGIDNSPEMLEKAASVPSRIEWVEADVAAWKPELPPDLIFSNATLQWLDDHDALFPRLLGTIAPGGCLAVQMPLSWGLDSHRLMRETLAHGGPDGQSLGSPELRQALAHVWVADAEHYFDLLAPDATALDLWETEYLQVLEGDDPVLNWVSGTGLRPVLNGLSDDDRATFLTRYTAALRTAYPRRPNGVTLYPFRRLFLIAQR